MKKYKLLKDTPTIKAGTVFEEVVGDFDGLKALTRITPVGAKTSPQFTIKDIDNFDEWFEEIPGNKRWRAEYAGRYWCNDGNGGIYSSTEDGHKADNYRFCTGNYFKTEEDAEAYKEYLLAKQKLIDSAKGYKPVLDGHNHYLEYCNGAFTKHFSVYETTTYTPGVIYFKYQEDAEESFHKYRDEWEIVRKYEMGEE
jgi:hypothetical protein|nr:MAG TPA: hypothetical protein [Caudoviricetes sp.]